MSDLRIETRPHPDGVAVVELHGVLDKRGIPDLERTIRGLIDEGRAKLVVDCAGLMHLSSDGMGVFLSHLIKLRKSGGDIKFAAMREEVRAVLALLGLTKLLVVKDSPADALADYAAGGKAARSREPEKLRVEVDQDAGGAGVAVVGLHGFVDRHTIALLDRALADLIERGRPRIVIDCAELGYISSNGMGVFISYVSKARSHGGDIRLCNLRDVARTVITMLGLHRHFEVFESRSDAVASFA